MEQPYQRIIVPVSGDSGDEQAIALASHVADQSHVLMTLIYVVEVAQAMPLDAELPTEIERGEEVLSIAEQYARSRVSTKHGTVTTDILQARSAGAAVVDEAIEQRADVIVISTTMRVKHGKLSPGETVGYVLKNAPCDVIILRQT
jgi:nucleotide-binding universal stress UspA family protein